MFGIDPFSITFWVGAALGVAFPKFFTAIWTFVKAKLKKDVPASVQADVAKVEAVVAPAAAVVEAVAAPVVAQVEAAMAPAANAAPTSGTASS